LDDRALEVEPVEALVTAAWMARDEVSSGRGHSRKATSRKRKGSGRKHHADG
jgi:hypothetical protein